MISVVVDNGVLGCAPAPANPPNENEPVGDAGAPVTVTASVVTDSLRQPDVF